AGFAGIAHGQQGVAHNAAALGARQRGLAKSLFKRKIIQFGELLQGDSGVETWRKYRAHARESIPRADFLAYIAAHHPISYPRPELLGDGAGMLDSEIGDAAAGV